MGQIWRDNAAAAMRGTQLWTLCGLCSCVARLWLWNSKRPVSAPRTASDSSISQSSSDEASTAAAGEPDGLAWAAPAAAEKELLYESLVPLESIAFYAAAYRPRAAKIEALINLALQAKALLKKHPQAIREFRMAGSGIKECLATGQPSEKALKNGAKAKSQLKPSAPSEAEAQRLLDLRGTFIADDKSKIFCAYIVEAQARMRRRQPAGTESAGQASKENEKPSGSKPGSADNISDKKYREMVMRIVEAVNAVENLAERLRTERDAFYRLRVPLSAAERRRACRSLVLGGAIVAPAQLTAYSQKIPAAERERLIPGWVRALLSPGAELERTLHVRLLHEQRAAVLAHLRECLQRISGRLDEAFEARSEILAAAGFEAAAREKENAGQVTFIRWLYRAIDSMMEGCGTGGRLMKYTREIESAYGKFLVSGEEEDKRMLFELLDA